MATKSPKPSLIVAILRLFFEVSKSGDGIAARFASLLVLGATLFVVVASALLNWATDRLEASAPVAGAWLAAFWSGAGP